MLSFNPYLQQIWSAQDVHQTWELLSNGIEDICSMIAPTIIVQPRSNFQPYINEEIFDLGKQVKLKFNNAITTKIAYDWDDYNKNKTSIKRKS